MSWMRVKNIRLESGLTTTGPAKISCELTNTWKDTYSQVKLLIYADLASYSSIDINRARLVFSKTYSNVGAYADITDTTTVDLSALKGKAVQLGYLLWVDGSYDGGNIPHTFAKPVYVCTGEASVASPLVMKDGQKVSTVNAGDYVDVRVSASLPYRQGRKVWAKLVLDDGTVVSDWVQLTHEVDSGSSSMFYGTVRAQVPDDEGNHSLISLIGYTFSTYYQSPPDNSLTVAGCASAGLTVKPPAPQLDQRALSSTLKLEWADLLNTQSRTFTAGDQVNVYAVVSTAGNGHYYLTATGPDGVSKTYDLGSHSAGETFSTLLKYTAPNSPGSYTITASLGVLDPASNTVRQITSSSLSFTVQQNMLALAKNSVLTINVPSEAFAGKPVTVSATITPEADGYYLVPVKVNGTPVTSAGPIQMAAKVPKTVSATLKFGSTGTYTVEMDLQYGQDGTHFYDLGIAKSATVVVKQPQLIKGWNAQPSKAYVIAGQVLPVVITVDWDTSVAQSVEFNAKVNAFGQSYSFPFTATSSPTTVTANIKAPDNLSPGVYDISVELDYE